MIRLVSFMKPIVRKWSTRLGLLLLAVFVVIQFVPSAPPVTLRSPVTCPVRLRRRRFFVGPATIAHSNETRWPWYSRIAPASWLVVRDVREGRNELNFSNWDQYSTRHRVKKLRESWEAVAEGEMPPWFYLPVHRDAQLTTQDPAVLRRWAIER